MQCFCDNFGKCGQSLVILFCIIAVWDELQKLLLYDLPPSSNLLPCNFVKFKCSVVQLFSKVIQLIRKCVESFIYSKYLQRCRVLSHVVCSVTACVQDVFYQHTMLWILQATGWWMHQRCIVSMWCQIFSRHCCEISNRTAV